MRRLSHVLDIQTLRTVYFAHFHSLVNYGIISWGNTTWCVQVLRSPKEAFAAPTQSWRERCEKCVYLHGDYIEK